MEEYQDQDPADATLASGAWVVAEATKLIAQYKACKTAYARNRLRPKLEYITKKLAFEGKEINKLTSGNYGDY